MTQQKLESDMTERKGKKAPAKAQTQKPSERKRKSPAGRPTDYQDKYAEMAYKLALLGLTDKEMAGVFGVTEQTLNNWKKAQPAFFESLTRGKIAADAEVAHSMYQRALGYEHDDVHISNFQGEITVTPVRKYYPPDTKAAAIWLSNRQSNKWREKVDVNHGTQEGDPIRDLISAVAGNTLKPKGDE